MVARRGKLLALMFAASAAGLALIAIALPVNQSLQTRAEIDAASERLAAIRRVGRAERGGEETAAATLLIGGDSASRATAEMLTHLQAVAGRHGIAIRSSNVMQSKPNGELGEISIQISYEARISAVRDLVHEIETGTPMIIIDELNMRTVAAASQTVGASAQPVRLDVTMTVSGLTKPREGP